jgi:DNA-binding MarR family transcriptional regulator
MRDQTNCGDQWDCSKYDNIQIGSKVWQLFWQKQITLAEWIVLPILQHYTKTRGNCTIPNRALAKQINRSRSYIRRLLQHLQKGGFIEFYHLNGVRYILVRVKDDAFSDRYVATRLQQIQQQYDNSGEEV